VTIRLDEGIFTLCSGDKAKTEDIVVFDKRYTLKSDTEVVIAL
jgi:hypothetical protein